MAVMGRKKQMVKRLVENRRTALNDEERKMREEEAKKQNTPEEQADKERILREAGLIK